MKHEKPARITISQQSTTGVNKEDATSEFIARMRTLLTELESGERTLKLGLITLVTNTLEKDLPKDLDPAKRKALLEGPRAGTEEVFAAGPQDDLMQLASKLPEHLAESLIAEHKEECDSDPDECVLHDPTVAPYIGTLRAMSMVFARISAEGNTEAAKFLHRSLKEMGRTAVRLSERHSAEAMLTALAPDALDGMNLELGDNASMIALGGEKAKRFFEALASSGILPPELEEKLRTQMANDAGNELELPEDNTSDGKKRTIVKNGSNTKH